MSDAGRKRRLLSEAQEAEVREQRDTSTQTHRVTAPGLEEILYEPLPERLLASDQCLGNRWMRMDNMGTQCKAVVLKRVGNLKQ
ncbi:MAG: hypothetical protein IH856_22295 [Deltaproteobacteria bacterium]|nr:hypothetical protein [Deltaproteobacteria bacterium]